MTTALDVDWLLDAGLAPDAADDTLAPLYSAAAADRLDLPFCADCESPIDLDQHVCDNCGSVRTLWRTVESTGTVHSATMMHRLEPGLVRTGAPYPILDVELTSGHRLIMTSRDRTEAVFHIGDQVTIGFRSLGGVAIPAACLVRLPSRPTKESTAQSISEEHP
ncbi:OB-fold domain-containing protein [Nocardia sp. NBC_00565]|uniref:OB-fold domain-containing protein n=1 Tax=Nocardia sp. NBC_00565 TaxID=2975993 RepID=UPI002E80229D|nr:OB-fold domain-containing protein [Nocardia sp. NBC_00565]WUC05697.1 OB-fold domain-containing protein [Nocardia sp. NBC_00565]